MKSISLGLLLAINSVLLCLPAFVKAQNTEEGTIRIRKNNIESKPGFKDRLCVGIKFGPSYNDFLESENDARNSLWTDRLNSFGAWDSRYTDGGPISHGNLATAQSSVLDPEKSFVLSMYGSYRLNKNFAFITELSYRSFAGLQSGGNNGLIGDDILGVYDTNTGLSYRYWFNTTFRYSSLEIPLLIQAQARWKFMEPFLNVGISPVFNLTAKRIVKVDSIDAPQFFKDEMQANGFDTENTVHKITKSGISFAIPVSAGFKVHISDAIAITVTQRFTGILTNNIIAEFPESNKLKMKDNFHSLSIGVEYSFASK